MYKKIWTMSLLINLALAHSVKAESSSGSDKKSNKTCLEQIIDENEKVKNRLLHGLSTPVTIHEQSAISASVTSAPTTSGEILGGYNMGPHYKLIQLIREAKVGAGEMLGYFQYRVVLGINCNQNCDYFNTNRYTSTFAMMVNKLEHSRGLCASAPKFPSVEEVANMAASKTSWSYDQISFQE